MTEISSHTGHAESTVVIDRRGREYEITADGVREVASRLVDRGPSRSAARVWARIGDDLLPAIDLIVPIAKTDDYWFRLSDLEGALAQLGFAVIRSATTTPVADHAGAWFGRRLVRVEVDDVALEETEPALYSVRTSLAMAAFAGRWVGVRADEIVSVGDSPTEVMSDADASDENPVLVTFVPRPADASE